MQVLSVPDTGRCCRWTDDKKIGIVDESHYDGATLAEVARRHEISRSVLYDWCYRQTCGALGALRNSCALSPKRTGHLLKTFPLSLSQPTVMTIDLGTRCHLSTLSDFDMEAAARFLNGLAMRP